MYNKKTVGTFNTTLPGLTFSNQFLQLSTRLSSSYLYGFGYNNHDHFRHDMNWRLWTLFVRASKPIGHWHYYSAHPVYMNLENDGNANMVLLKNSNAMGM
ncbi:hypothetical protein KUTeg_012141 [Tegillarca granosa]|uniref:Uncharacterized protein n=1 Tax=Tegillarca granosa TaxID=220873 RepID=A0ABQ9F132_TEGGR|nr:hypothetical protein KUTeg_012141 [Tegillarca granosa]